MTAGEVRLPANKPASNCEVDPSKGGRRSCPPCPEDPLSIQIDTKAVSFHFLPFSRPWDRPYIGNTAKDFWKVFCQKCTCHSNVAWFKKKKTKTEVQTIFRDVALSGGFLSMGCNSTQYSSNRSFNKQVKKRILHVTLYSRSRSLVCVRASKTQTSLETFAFGLSQSFVAEAGQGRAVLHKLTFQALADEFLPPLFVENNKPP